MKRSGVSTPLLESKTHYEELWFNSANTDTNLWAGIIVTWQPVTGGMGQFGTTISVINVFAMKCEMCFPLECHQSAKVRSVVLKRVGARFGLALVPGHFSHAVFNTLASDAFGDFRKIHRNARGFVREFLPFGKCSGPGWSIKRPSKSCSLHSKKNFWLRVRIICEWRHKWRTFRPPWPTLPGLGRQMLDGSISLKFLLETRLQSKPFDTLDESWWMGKSTLATDPQNDNKNNILCRWYSFDYFYFMYTWHTMWHYMFACSQSHKYPPKTSEIELVHLEIVGNSTQIFGHTILAYPWTICRILSLHIFQHDNFLGRGFPATKCSWKASRPFCTRLSPSMSCQMVLEFCLHSSMGCLDMVVHSIHVLNHSIIHIPYFQWK